MPLIILVFSFFLAYKNTNSWIHPARIMSIVWVASMSVFLSGIIPYYEVKPETTYIISLGVLSFVVGALIVNQKSSNDTSSISWYSNNYKVNRVTVIVLEIVSIILLTPSALMSIAFLQGGGDFESIRADYSSGFALGSPVLAIIYNYIAKSFAVLINPVLATTFYSYFSNKKKSDLLIIVLGVIIVVETLLVGGGRFCLLYPLICLLVLYVYNSNTGSNIFHINKKIITFLLVMIVIAIIISIIRVSISRGIEDVGSSFLQYISGPIPLLDIHLQRIENIEPCYGAVFLNGIIRFFVQLFDFFGFGVPAFADNVLELINVEDTYMVGDNSRMNAFVTCFYYFYLDGKWPAVIIESLIWGSISAGIYKKALAGDIRFLFIYMIFSVALVTSIVRFQFVSYNYIMAIMLVYMVVPKNIKYERH